MAGDTNTRAYITNQVLAVEIKHVNESLERLDKTIAGAAGEMKEQAKRTVDVEKCIVALTHDFDNLDEKVDDLAELNKKYSRWTAVGAAFGTAFASALAILGIRNG